MPLSEDELCSSSVDLRAGWDCLMNVCRSVLSDPGFYSFTRLSEVDELSAGLNSIFGVILFPY